ncbi:MAG: M14 family metallocarboxypeptidase [Actinomycetota bacterium]
MRRAITILLAAFRAASVALATGASGRVLPPQDGGGGEPPKTQFEETEGAEWTSHENELRFLAEVDALSDRVEIAVVGKTAEGRPMHLVQMGAPRPVSAAQARNRPTLLFVCSQHGNEPAGREACLKLLRDLAFTEDKTLVSQLEDMTVLFIPSANPDGSAANTRGNAAGTDINRDHLNLKTPEARAMAAVVREWEPEVSMDLHEYGPSLPVVYDDEVLLLWPRNLNIDQQVHDLAHGLVNEHLMPKTEEAGYTADEYGQYEIADNDIHQAAGDGDEGIMRNAMGLRHSLGVLVESAVTADPRNGPGEVLSEAEVNLRRVDSHMAVSLAALEYMRDRGGAVAKATSGAFDRKTAEGRKRSAPVYFDGADNEEPTVMQDPPPCGYRLDAEQFDAVSLTLELLGVKTKKAGASYFVPMAQPAEPLIPLLLDERGNRHAVAAEMLETC